MNATLDPTTPTHSDGRPSTSVTSPGSAVERDWCAELPSVDPGLVLDYYEHFSSVRVLRHHLAP